MKAQMGANALPFTVLYDPLGQTKQALALTSVNDWHFVMNAGGEITYRAHYPAEAAVEAAIEDALAD